MGFPGDPWEYVITVCDNANERCPLFPGRTTRLHWSFEDPSQATGSEDQRVDTFRRVRDQIHARVSDGWRRALEATELADGP